jgi:hypothetical protein
MFGTISHNFISKFLALTWNLVQGPLGKPKIDKELPYRDSACLVAISPVGKSH